MEKNELKNGYRLAKSADSKEGLIYFVLKADSERVTRNRITGSDDDFQKRVASKEAYVAAQAPPEKKSTSSTSSTTTGAKK
jgi:hypothetical protein